MFQREMEMNKQLACLGMSLCLWTTLLPGLARPADDDIRVRIATGIEYTSGDYGGSTELEETYVPVTLSVTGGRVGARLTVPYLTVSGPESALYGDPGGEVDVVSDPQAREGGLGDVVGALTVFDLISSPKYGLAVDLTGKIKFGTADAETGLGTGENDYSVLVDMYKFIDRGALLATAGYKFRGEPAGVRLDNVFLGSLGALFDVGNRSRFGLFYDYREASLTDTDELRELSLFAAHDLGNSWRVQYYVFTGLTDSGPDWGAGLHIGINLPGIPSRQRD